VGQGTSSAGSRGHVSLQLEQLTVIPPSPLALLLPPPQHDICLIDWLPDLLQVPAPRREEAGLALGGLVMLVVVDDGKTGVRGGPRGVEPRDNGFGAVEKGWRVLPK
jgi:hypothetical protein